VTQAYDDPKLIAEAKRKAAGPLGKHLADFPLRFSAPVVFSEVPSRGQPPSLNNGTISLVELGGRQFGITCHHVISAFREKHSSTSSSIFQIGNLKINPLERVISESKDLDLAILDLSDVDSGQISMGREVNFFQPVSWPSSTVAPGQFVAFGGFPGVWRNYPEHLEITFDSFSLGATMVSDVGARNVVCKLEREYWIQSSGPWPVQDFQQFGGLSGGPVFIFNGLKAEFVGVIYEYSTTDDYLLIRPSSFINEDGMLAEV
jgi:hypothetical protein